MSHHVSAVIQDGFARTEIEETFKNETTETLEGRYVFAVPEGASISRLALWVEGAWAEGKVVDKRGARSALRGIAESAVPQGTAQRGTNTLSLRIFPLEPGASRRVVVAYNEVLPAQGDGFAYRYPLAARRPMPVADFSLKVRASDRRRSPHSARVQPAEARLLETGDSLRAEFIRKDFTPNADFVLNYRVANQAPRSAVYLPARGRGLDKSLPPVAPNLQDTGYFALEVRVVPPESFVRDALGLFPRVMIIDRSWAQAAALGSQVSLAQIWLEELARDEPFAVLVCDSACESFPPDGVRTMSPAAFAEAFRWLQTVVEPRGALDLAGALRAALQHVQGAEHAQLVYTGGGTATAGELLVPQIAAALDPLLTQSRDFRFLGLGPVVDVAFLSSLSATVGGYFERFTQYASRARPGHAFVQSLFHPMVDDIQLMVPGTVLEVTPSSPLRLPEQSGLLVTGKFEGLGDVPIALRGKVFGRSFTTQTTLRVGDATQQNPLVPRLWAEQRLRELERSASAKDKPTISKLSQDYHVMTRLTTLLVEDNQAVFSRYRDGKAAPGAHQPPEPSAELASIANGTAQGFDAAVGRPGSNANVGPRMHMGTVVVRGPLGREVVQRLLQRSYERFRLCYETGARANPLLAGDVTVEFTVNGDGRVVNPRAIGGTLPDQTTVQCIVRAHQGLLFPKPAAATALIQAGLSFTPPERGWRALGQPFSGTPPTASRHLPGTESWAQMPDWMLAGYRDHVGKDPSSAAARYAISHLLAGGAFADARAIALQQAAAFSNDVLVHQALATLYALEGDGLRAAFATATASAIAPEEPSLQLRTAHAFDNANEPGRACAHYRAAASLGSNEPDALVRSAHCLTQLGDAATLRQLVEELPTRGITDERVLDALRDAAAQAAVAEPEEGATEPPAAPSLLASGLFSIKVECRADVERCPAPLVRTPDGDFFSPWAPDWAPSGANLVELAQPVQGTYRTLLVGGSPGAEGQVILSLPNGVSTVPFTYNPAAPTVVESDVAFRR